MEHTCHDPRVAETCEACRQPTEDYLAGYEAAQAGYKRGFNDGFSVGIKAAAEVARSHKECGYDCAREIAQEIERLKPEGAVDDGFGNIWTPCEKCGSRMQVVRPGSAKCPRCDP